MMTRFKKHSLFFIIVLLVEIVGIGYLVLKIQDKISNNVSITPIPKGNLILDETDNLKYFYEFQRTHDGFSVPDWAPEEPQYLTNLNLLNERFDYSTEKPGNTYRIITLGDSWTFGVFVSTKKNFSEKLEDLLNNQSPCKKSFKFEVINLGVPGYNIGYSVERFKRRGQKYDPDLVIWLLIKNDFDQIFEFMQPKFLYYSDQIKKGREPGVDTDSNGDTSSQLENPNEAWQMATDDLLEKYGEDGLIKYQGIALKSINNYHKGPLILYSIPSGSAIDKKFYPIIKNFVKERKHSVFYETSLQLKKNDTLFPDGHPSIKGHEEIAKDLFEYLTKKNVISCEN